MQRVQTRGHLHRLHFIYGLTRRIERTTQIQWRTAVGVVVLDDQILHLLGIHERSRKGVLLRLDVVVVLETVGSKHLLHLLVWAWGNLVNHRPGESNLLLVFQVSQELSRHQSVFHPALSIGKDTGLHLVAVVRAVVHRLHRER